MATVVQHKPVTDWSNFNSVWNLSFDNPTTAGNAIILLVAGSGPPASIGVTDDHSGGSNSYHSDFQLVSGTVRYGIFSAPGAGSAQTLTVTFNTSSKIQSVLMEVSGLKSTGTISDQTVSHDNGFISNPSNQSFTSNATGTTTQANEWIFGVVYNIFPGNVTWVDDSPWSVIDMTSLDGARAACHEASSTGTFTYTGRYSNTGDTQVTAIVVTYLEASAPAAAGTPVMGFEPDFIWLGGDEY